VAVCGTGNANAAGGSVTITEVDPVPIPLRSLALQLVLMLPHERREAYWLAEEYVAFIDYGAITEEAHHRRRNAHREVLRRPAEGTAVGPNEEVGAPDRGDAPFMATDSASLLAPDVISTAAPEFAAGGRVPLP